MTKARDLANGGFGLVLIKPSTVVNGTDNGKGTVSFSAQSSITLRNVFSSTYTNYRVLVDITTTSTDMDLLLRFGNSGSADTTANYYYAYWARTNGGVDDSRQGNGTTSNFLAPMETYSGNGFTSVSADIHKPFLATETQGISQYATVNQAGSVVFGSGGFWKGSSTSWSDLFILTSTGTATGTIQVYGYNN
jgi:hypothetical protein